MEGQDIANLIEDSLCVCVRVRMNKYINETGKIEQKNTINKNYITESRGSIYKEQCSRGEKVRKKEERIERMICPLPFLLSVFWAFLYVIFLFLGRGHLVAKRTHVGDT